jgi:hypothetical protein
MPTFVGMTRRHGPRVDLNADWYKVCLWPGSTSRAENAEIMRSQRRLSCAFGAARAAPHGTSQSTSYRAEQRLEKPGPGLTANGKTLCDLTISACSALTAVAEAVQAVPVGDIDGSPGNSGDGLSSPSSQATEERPRRGCHRGRCNVTKVSYFQRTTGWTGCQSWLRGRRPYITPPASPPESARTAPGTPARPPGSATAAASFRPGCPATAPPRSSRWSAGTGSSPRPYAG